MKDYVGKLLSKQKEAQPLISEENAEKLFEALALNSGFNLSIDADGKQNDMLKEAVNTIIGVIIRYYMSGAITNTENESGLRVSQKTKSGVNLDYRMPIAADIAACDAFELGSMGRSIALMGRLSGRGAGVIEKLSGNDKRVMEALAGFFSMC